MNMSISRAKRLEILEGHANRQNSEPLDIVRVFVNVDGSIAGASRRGKHGERVPVSEAELADILRITT
ncbi:MAG TPA: hypothetical protein VFF41_03105 [Gallionella sp.]|nr:hypothetical protein [Gallionella sp.]